MKSFHLSQMFLSAGLTLAHKTTLSSIGYWLYFSGLVMINWCNTTQTPSGFLWAQRDAYFMVVQGLSYEHRRGTE